ncbi:hypothetical protein ACH4OX_24275 [Streptomyces roseolus]|uniref:hypothetical protein n=1 Tax=Streptomyces roseolus TaxID=67358 RepID=UPI0037950E75
MPSLPPPRTTEIFYDTAWHPATVREADPVTITRGLTGKGTRAEPTAASMTLANRDGRYSPHNPSSPLYGLIGRNTPLKFSVDAGGPWAVLPGDTTAALTTPDHAALGSTDLDLRVELASNDYAVQQDLAERWLTTGNQRSWAWMLVGGQLHLRWSPDGTGTALGLAISPSVVPARPGQRIALRATLDVNNGSGGWTANFFWARRLDSPVWEPLGTVSGSGVTSVYDGTAGLRLGTAAGFVGPGVLGRVYGMQLRTGIGGPVAVDLRIPRDAEVGASSFTDGTGLVWSLVGAATLSNRHVRLHGEVPAWPPERHISGNDSTVAIAPAGILRRLGIGRKPLDSVLRRLLSSNAPVDCWPLTDGPAASSAASLVGGAPALVQSGPSGYAWGAGTLTEWVEPVMEITTSTQITAVPPLDPAAATGWAVDWTLVWHQDTLLIVTASEQGPEATARSWEVTGIQAFDQLLLKTFTEAGGAVTRTTIAAPGIFDGQPHHVRLSTSVAGADVIWRIYIDGIHRDTGVFAGTLAPLVRVVARTGTPDATSRVMTLGYLTYWGPTAPGAAVVHQALLGNVGETAGARIARVAGEQGVPIVLDGDPAETEALGVQEMNTFLDVLETASDADLGLLLDQRDARGLLYRTRRTLYTQAPALTLDYSTGVISGQLRPVDDDRLTRNSITAKRDRGSEHTAVKETGRMSVKDPEDGGVGLYDEAVTLSLGADSQTVDQAWWRMHLGTVEGLRYPRITVDLANPRAYQLATDVLDVDAGDIIRLANLPAEYGPGDVDLIVRGYTEEVGAERWRITFVCDPGAPWMVGLTDSPVYGRADTDGSHLGVAVDADDTTMVLVSTAGPEWIRTATHGSEFPFDLTVGGEQVRVTGVTGVIEDGFARTVASGWGTADSGQAWTRAGGVASDFSVSGGVGVHTATTRALRVTTAPVPVADLDVRADCSMSAVPAGGAASIYTFARRLSSADFYSARLLIAAGGAITLSLRKVIGGTDTELASYATGMTLTANTWFTLRFSVQGASLRTKVWPRGSAEPEAWQATATDTSLTGLGVVGAGTALGSTTTNVLPVSFSFDNFGSLPQQATVVRSVNGVVKTHAVGTNVSLTTPMTVAL